MGDRDIRLERERERHDVWVTGIQGEAFFSFSHAYIVYDHRFTPFPGTCKCVCVSVCVWVCVCVCVFVVYYENDARFHLAEHTCVLSLPIKLISSYT